MECTNSNNTEKNQQETPKVTPSSHKCKDNLYSTECSLRVTRSFTGALENLTINCDAPKKKKKSGIRNGNSSTPKEKVMPCSHMDFQVKEKSFVQEQYTKHYIGSEIFKYQGNQYSVEEVAIIWKKDCRTWLWKGVYKSRKKRRQFPQLMHTNDFAKSRNDCYQDVNTHK